MPCPDLGPALSLPRSLTVRCSTKLKVEQHRICLLSGSHSSMALSFNFITWRSSWPRVRRNWEFRMQTSAVLYDVHWRPRRFLVCLPFATWSIRFGEVPSESWLCCEQAMPCLRPPSPTMSKFPYSGFLGDGGMQSAHGMVSLRLDTALWHPWTVQLGHCVNDNQQRMCQSHDSHHHNIVAHTHVQV